MGDEQRREDKWTAAERAGLRKLVRMALIMLLAIVVAGTVAALLSSGHEEPCDWHWVMRAGIRGIMRQR